MPITLLDGILIGFTLVSAILAMVRGFSREVLSIVSWVAAAVGAFYLYPLVLPYVQPHINNQTLALAVAAGSAGDPGRAEVLALADGSIFTGRQALERKLVDGLGGQDEAVAWLSGKGVDKELDVIEWKPAGRGGLLSPLSLAGTLGALTGLDRVGAELARKAGAERLFLDGLLSVWQPDAASFSD